MGSDILQKRFPECTLPSLKGAPAQANIEGANSLLLSSVHPSLKREVDLKDWQPKNEDLLRMKLCQCSIIILPQLNPAKRDLIFMLSEPSVVHMNSAWSGVGATAHLSDVQSI